MQQAFSQSIKAGSTSVSIMIFFAANSTVSGQSYVGGGKTGITSGSPDLLFYYCLPAASAVNVAITDLAATNSAWSSGGIKEISAANMPGWYRFDIPNAAIASGRQVALYFKAPAMSYPYSGDRWPLALSIQLTATNEQDAVRGGMTALPDAAAEAAGGLYTRGTGAGQINQNANGSVDSNTKTWNALTTVALPLVPTTAGRTLVVDASGLADANMVKMGPTGAGTVQTAKDLGVFAVKKNAALTAFSFPMFDSAGAGKTAATVACQRSIDGAAFANCTVATATEVSGGWYKVDLSAADLNGAVIALKFTATGALDTAYTILTQA